MYFAHIVKVICLGSQNHLENPWSKSQSIGLVQPSPSGPRSLRSLEKSNSFSLIIVDYDDKFHTLRSIDNGGKIAQIEKKKLASFFSNIGSRAFAHAASVDVWSKRYAGDDQEEDDGDNYDNSDDYDVGDDNDNDNENDDYDDDDDDIDDDYDDDDDDDYDDYDDDDLTWQLGQYRVCEGELQPFFSNEKLETENR